MEGNKIGCVAHANERMTSPDKTEDHLLCVSRYAIRSARSASFFRPANTIFVPGMYFLGFSRYSNNVSLDHTMSTQQQSQLYIIQNVA